jgi:serine/threonine-protein kinase
MGVVLKAFDRSLNRHVAIKVLSPFLAGAAAARLRFAREARAMAALSHEHVAPIYAVDEHRGLPYFAMEYVPGGTLSARLAAEGPLEVVAAVRIAMQTALALAAAHDSGLVHRDIKPANILLDRGVERVRVADFGLARAASEATETASGMLAGTPQYMSPEQIHRDACDARSDLFSLGSVMYAMCTGHAPFRAESVFAVLQRIVHDEPRPVRDANPNVPAWLEAFIERLMAKDRDERFQSAAEVAELLARELAHLQDPRRHPAPPRPWLPRRGWRFLASRHKRATAAVAASVVGVALTALAWQLVGRDAEKTGGAAANIGAPLPARLPLEPPTATMWNADGFEAVAAYGDAIEADALRDEAIGAPGPVPLDPWTFDVILLQLNVNSADGPTIFPETQRTEP